MLFDSSDPAPNILERPRWWEATGRHCLAIVWARSWGLRDQTRTGAAGHAKHTTRRATGSNNGPIPGIPECDGRRSQPQSLSFEFWGNPDVGCSVSYSAVFAGEGRLRLEQCPPQCGEYPCGPSL